MLTDISDKNEFLMKWTRSFAILMPRLNYHGYYSRYTIMAVVRDQDKLFDGEDFHMQEHDQQS